MVSNIWDAIVDFTSREAGQRRRAWLNEKERGLIDTAQYFAGPSIPVESAVGLLDMLNPVADAQRAMGASREMMEPGRTPGQRVKSGAEMLTDVASIVAPVAAGRIAGAPTADDAARLVDSFTGVGAMQRQGATDAGRRFAVSEGGSVGNSLTPAERQAQDILDMLSEGRARDITDDMMAAADDAYLYRNYDLPMDEASRMARAREMGLDTDQTWYHGTPDNRGLDAGFATQYERFDPNRPRRGPYFLTDNRRVAATYADDSRAFDYQGADPEVLSLYSRAEGPLTVDARGDTFRGIDGNNVRSAYLDQYGPGPAMDNIDRELMRLARGEDGNRLSTDGLAELSERFGGHDTVDVRRVKDTYTGDGPQSTVRMFRDPTNVRRTTARFDPRLSHLRNLSAGVGGAGLLASGLSQQDGGGEMQEIIQYLNSVGAL